MTRFRDERGAGGFYCVMTRHGIKEVPLPETEPTYDCGCTPTMTLCDCEAGCWHLLTPGEEGSPRSERDLVLRGPLRTERTDGRRTH